METTVPTEPLLSSLTISSPMTQSMTRRNQELHSTLHRAETLISHSSSLVHPPWIEKHRKQRQLQIEKERQQEINNARQWASRNTRSQNEDDDDNGKPLTEEIVNTKLRLRLLMGQSIDRATNGLPLPGTLQNHSSSVTINTSTNSSKSSFHIPNGGTRRGILTNVSNEAAQQRQARRNSLVTGQGITEAFQRPKTSTSIDDFDIKIVSPRHERRHHKHGLQKPEPSHKTLHQSQRRNSQGYLKGALDDAAEGNIGFTGIHLDNAPLHTKHLEELRRQVIEASKAVASRRQDVLNMISMYTQPSWRPEGRIKYFAALNAVNLPASSSSPNGGGTGGNNPGSLEGTDNPSNVTVQE